MKVPYVIAGALVALMLLALPVAAASVEPVLFDPWPPAGQHGQDAYAECGYAGVCDADWAWKLEWSGIMDGTYGPLDGGNTIVISNDDGSTFDWMSEFPVCKVIVKGGTVANVFYYEGGAYGDTDLYAPFNPNSGKTYGISHATFCYNDPETDYCDETAWAVGNRYVAKGNWAMYVPYAGAENTVVLRADGGDGVGINVGTVTFAPGTGGSVDITIALTGGAVFNYDPADPVHDDNVKVEGYTRAPAKTPSPGLFTYKYPVPVGETEFTFNVPYNKFYGVHVDVKVPCTA